MIKTQCELSFIVIFGMTQTNITFFLFQFDNQHSSMTNRCKDCNDMWCRTYYLKKEIWQGICKHDGSKVKGDDSCHITKQLGLFNNN